MRDEVTAHPCARPPTRPVIVATGPLTSAALSADIARFVGSEHLSFFDAISPIVLAETIDMSKVFRQSRWDRLSRRPVELSAGQLRSHRQRDRLAERPAPSEGPVVASAVDCLVEGDYLNCPFTADEYARFYDAIVTAEKADGARLRQHEVLRGLSADRGDGASRRRHAAVRADEAGRA